MWQCRIEVESGAEKEQEAAGERTEVGIGTLGEIKVIARKVDHRSEEGL